MNLKDIEKTAKEEVEKKPYYVLLGQKAMKEFNKIMKIEFDKEISKLKK